MPTGYTADLYEGKDLTFPEFAAKCAHAFGALLELRDEPAKTTLPELADDSGTEYHDKHIEDDTAALTALNAMSEAELSAAALSEHEAAVASWEKSMAEQADRRERYESMLSSVRAWKPPTDEHKGLHEFMESQLTESIKFDCGYTGERPELKTPAEYKASRVSSLSWSLNYHMEQKAKSVERVAGRREWIEALRDSLNAVAV
jgi:hypothetical protein